MYFTVDRFTGEKKRIEFKERKVAYDNFDYDERVVDDSHFVQKNDVLKHFLATGHLSNARVGHYDSDNRLGDVLGEIRGAKDITEQNAIIDRELDSLNKKVKRAVSNKKLQDEIAQSNKESTEEIKNDDKN